jgi:gamma-glutamyl:cysteine ligase YbdK (ATP-grasp superfamily)
MLEECGAELGQQFSAEYQRSQVEVVTKVRTSASTARAELAHLRNTVAAIASRYGLAPIAASTHPFTPWSTQRHANKQRYNAIAHDLRGVGRRMVISGMHVHVDATQRDTGAVRELERLLHDDWNTGALGRDRGRDQDLVGPAPLGTVSNARIADYRYLSPD